MEGTRGLQDLREGDQRKAKRCVTFGIDPIVVDYAKPLTENYIYGTLIERGYPQERHIDNERNMNRDTRSCPFCKTQASVNARFCNKCGKPLKLSMEAGSMAKPVSIRKTPYRTPRCPPHPSPTSTIPPRALPPSPPTASAPSSYTHGTAISNMPGATTNSSRCPRPTPTRSRPRYS